MSIAMPNPLAGKSGGSVSIFGRKISYDALLLAAASLAGVFFLYKVGQPGQAAFDASSIDPNAGSAGDFSMVSTQPQQPQTAGGYWGVPAAAGGTLPAIQSAFQVAAGGLQPAPSHLAQWQGTQGSAGGPNTTGRTSGSQIFGMDAVAVGGSGGHAPSTPPSGGGGFGGGGYGGGFGSGGRAPASAIPMPATFLGAPTRNAQGQSRSSGGQILQ